MLVGTALDGQYQQTALDGQYQHTSRSPVGWPKKCHISLNVKPWICCMHIEINYAGIPPHQWFGKMEQFNSSANITTA